MFPSARTSRPCCAAYAYNYAQASTYFGWEGHDTGGRGATAWLVNVRENRHRPGPPDQGRPFVVGCDGAQLQRGAGFHGLQGRSITRRPHRSLIIDINSLRRPRTISLASLAAMPSSRERSANPVDVSRRSPRLACGSSLMLRPDDDSVAFERTEKALRSTVAVVQPGTSTGCSACERLRVAVAHGQPVARPAGSLPRRGTPPTPCRPTWARGMCFRHPGTPRISPWKLGRVVRGRLAESTLLGHLRDRAPTACGHVHDACPHSGAKQDRGSGGRRKEDPPVVAGPGVGAPPSGPGASGTIRTNSPERLSGPAEHREWPAPRRRPWATASPWWGRDPAGPCSGTTDRTKALLESFGAHVLGEFLPGKSGTG